MEIGQLLILLSWLALVHCKPMDQQEQTEETGNVERKIEEALEAADPAVLATALAGNPDLVNITLQHADRSQLDLALKESNLDILKVVLSKSRPDLLMAAFNATLDNLRVILTGANENETAHDNDYEFEKENEIEDTTPMKNNNVVEEILEKGERLKDFEELENIVNESTKIKSSSKAGKRCQSKDEGYFGKCTTVEQCPDNEFSYSVTCSFEVVCCKDKL